MRTGPAESKTNSSVNLVRTEDRNIIRNSGQYWKIFGLIDDSARGEIQLTPFGIAVANANISQAEFAFKVVQEFELPNIHIESHQTIQQWRSAGIRIKPLSLILEVIWNLSNFSTAESFITPHELIKYVIPMSGCNQIASNIASTLISIRKGSNHDVFDDCCPEANDRRMAREFILFLENYGILINSGVGEGYDARYVAEDLSREDLVRVIDIPQPQLNALESITIPEFERRRVQREITQRPNQPRFREAVLQAYNAKCFLTGTNIPSVLEAAHIIPVSENGRDQVNNGLCLRRDVHTLFDRGHIRITREGRIVMPSNYRNPNNYSYIPETIRIPEFVDLSYLDWRIKYM